MAEMESCPLYAQAERAREPRLKRVRLEGLRVVRNAPAVLICPGGGYRFVSTANEGRPFAEACAAHGLNAFVLTYSVGRRARYPNPLRDLARAVWYLRENAEALEIDADRLVLMGSSAAGHLCALFAAQYKIFEAEYAQRPQSLRPQGLVLCYPVVTMTRGLTHRGSCRRLLGLFPGNAAREAASPERLVTPDYPPVFLWHCKDDRCVNFRNSTRFADALRENGVAYELKLYPRGGHGIGLAAGREAGDWFGLACRFLSETLLKPREQPISSNTQKDL